LAEIPITDKKNAEAPEDFPTLLRLGCDGMH